MRRENAGYGITGVVLSSRVTLSNKVQSRGAWRHALLASGAFALLAVPFLIAGLLPAKAQIVTDPVEDIVIVPPIIQSNNLGNDNVAQDILNFASATSTTVGSPIVVLDSPDAQSLASAIAAVQGTATPNDPVIIDQSTDDDDLNIGISNIINNVDRIATARAFSGLVDITNTTVSGGTLALSRAEARSALDSSNSQLHDNDIIVNGDATQVGTQLNTIFNTRLPATSEAISGRVIVSSEGPVDSLTHGVDARSEAETHSHIGIEVVQRNENSLTGEDGPDQDVGQVNNSEQNLIATAVATSGDVSVTSTGPVSAPGHGLRAVSSAVTETGARIHSTVDQLNQNVLTGEDDSQTEVDQNQDLSQDNLSPLSMNAENTSTSGNAFVENTGPGGVTSGDNALEARSTAQAKASISGDFDQANTNLQSFDNDATLEQRQGSGNDDWTQLNSISPRIDFVEVRTTATATAEAGDAEVRSSGDLVTDETAAKALSEADAEATIGVDVTQSNTNTLDADLDFGGGGNGQSEIFQGQPNSFDPENPFEGDWFQTNFNTQRYDAEATATAGTATVDKTSGKIAATDGTVAKSSANARAMVDNAVDQDNSNTLTADHLTTFPQGGQVRQRNGGNDAFAQINDSTEDFTASATGQSRLATIDNAGDTFASGTGHQAVSEAISTADIGSGNTVNQNNTNMMTGSTNGFNVSLSQVQGFSFEGVNEDSLFEQLNRNRQTYKADAQAIAGAELAADVDVTGNTVAGDDGVIARAEARADATNSGAVAQDNENTVEGNKEISGMGLIQAQGRSEGDFVNEELDEARFRQQNANTNSLDDPTLYDAKAEAVAGGATARNVGHVHAGKSAVSAVANATANATNNGSVDQENKNELTARANFRVTAFEDFVSDITQAQGTGRRDRLGEGDWKQLNDNAQDFLADADATAGAARADANPDASSWHDIALLKAGNYGVRAESVAIANATNNGSVDQRSINKLDAETGNDSGTRRGEIDQEQGVARGDFDQDNDNRQRFNADAFALSDIAEVKSRAVTHAGDDGILARSGAEANATNNGGTVSQSNQNDVTATTTGADSDITQGQGVDAIRFIPESVVDFEIDNDNLQSFVATAIAQSDEAYVDSKGYTAAGDSGVRALSDATARAENNGAVSQENKNTLTASTSGTNEGETTSSILQQQGVDIRREAEFQEWEQENDNGFFIDFETEASRGGYSAIAVAEADRAGVYNKGAVHAETDGVSATSSAVAYAANNSSVTQNNENTTTATANGTRAGITQQQGRRDGTFRQENLNENRQEGNEDEDRNRYDAFAQAVAGPASVDNRGGTWAGDHGIVARSSAVAVARNNGDGNGGDDYGSVIQTNKNTLTANSTNPENANADDEFDVIQEQGKGPGKHDSIFIQNNENREKYVADAGAEADYASVDAKGSVHAGKDGVAAFSEAIATAVNNGSVDQDNENQTNATTAGEDINVIQHQGRAFGDEPEELNANEQEQDEDPEGEFEQLNENDQVYEADADAASSTASVYNQGHTTAHNEGVYARSSAEANALNNPGDTVSQTNTNGLDAATTGNLSDIDQEQGNDGGEFTQDNENDQDFDADADADAGEAITESHGTTLAGAIGVGASSSAVANAVNNESVTQENSNTLDADTEGVDAEIEQEQARNGGDFKQLNNNDQDFDADAEATSDVATVYARGGIFAGSDGVAAESRAVANALNNVSGSDGDDEEVPYVGSVSQTNTNTVTGDTADESNEPENSSVVIQVQGTGLADSAFVQENESEQDYSANARAYSDRASVDHRGFAGALGNGVSAVSDAAAYAVNNGSVTQTNDNSLTATTDAGGSDVTQRQANGPGGDFEQENENGDGNDPNSYEASAYAGSGPATAVSRGVILAGQDGLAARSSASAHALNNAAGSDGDYNGAGTVTQTNTNTLNAATEGEAADVQQEQGFDGGDFEQENENTEVYRADAEADSDTASAYGDGLTAAHNNGVSAVSEAVAIAANKGSIAQSNLNTVMGQANGDDTFVAQRQGVADGEFVQQNENTQIYGAEADAYSDTASVAYWGDIFAGENGILAHSMAIANADTVQTIDQSNINDVSTSETVTAELQGVEQFNFNLQGGSAEADAESEEVHVDQRGEIHAHGNGIDARSVAAAYADVEQYAGQENESVRTGEENPEGNGELNFNTHAAQRNTNIQDGLATADAESDDVRVIAENDPAGGIGIVAESRAVAVANVVQSGSAPDYEEDATEGQSNVNSTPALFQAREGGQLIDLSVEDEPGFGGGAGLPLPEGFEPIGGLLGLIDVDVALQTEIVGQNNVNLQGAISTATSEADDVYVEQWGVLKSGGDSIKATSTASSVATVDQSQTQSNLNDAAALYRGSPLFFSPAEQLPNGFLNLGIQAQVPIVGQSNINAQGGLAIADAEADSVTVYSAWVGSGDDGIVAKSVAGYEGGASVTQSIDQSNENNGSVVYDANDIEFVVAPRPDVPLPIEPEIVDIAAQVQLLGQTNLSLQGGAGIANSSAGPVSVFAGDLHSGGYGIDAASSAVAYAPVTQTASQRNRNTGDAFFEGGDLILVSEREEDPDIVIQTVFFGQLNINVQLGLAVAEATSDAVYVEQDGTVNVAGTGIQATSSAYATAELNQTADQRNFNDSQRFGTRFFDPRRGVQAFSPFGPSQLNVNLQAGAAIALAEAGPVTVKSLDDPAGGDGINAVSSATATASLDQTLDVDGDDGRNPPGQSNRNIVDIEPVGDDGEFFIPEFVESPKQTNFNLQAGAAIAIASSDTVTAQQVGRLHAGEDGIDATSEALATANVTQTADQRNRTVFNAPDISNGDFEIEIPARTDISPADQDNLNIQGGLSFASAGKGDDEENGEENGQENGQENGYGGNDVHVTKLGTLSSVGTGLAAKSLAVSDADLNQTVDQANINRLDSSESVLLEFEGARQNNINLQLGGAVALSRSGDVTVDQLGTMNTGGNGIDAESIAMANADAIQDATQRNNNQATGAGDFLFDQFSDQVVGQLNLNAQLGGAFAEAESGKVTVRNLNDPSGGIGIVATSAAGANATVVQSGPELDSDEIGQSNVNRVAGRFIEERFDFPEGTEFSTDSLPVADNAEIPEEAELPEINIDTDISGQIVGQANVSLQGGVAIADAESEDVEVLQLDVLQTGDDGINAVSSAVSTASLDQRQSQRNANRAEAFFDGGEFIPPEPILVDELEDGEFNLFVGGEGQFIGQANVNVQLGLAVATAESDDVTVVSSRVRSHGDGIVAISSAGYDDAGASLDQSVAQNNVNNATANFSFFNEEIFAAQQNIVPVEELEGLDGGSFGLSITGQLIGQANLNVQGGAALARSEADTVTVRSGGFTTEGHGIIAVSTADGDASLAQYASQKNRNTARTTFEFPHFGNSVAEVVEQVDLDGDFFLELEGQLVGQANINVQGGAAVSVARGGTVHVDQVRSAKSGGTGITAASTAVSNANVTQSATQDNISTLTLEDDPQQFFENGEDQILGQLNVSLQDGVAVGLAQSDAVSVNKAGKLTAGGHGIDASSSAKAYANVDQDVYQDNRSRPRGAAKQANLALQRGLAVGVASSGPVTVVQKGTIQAAGTGIKGVSDAEAHATVDQDIYQDNNGRGTNRERQRAGAFAFAGSDQVSIESDNVTAGGDGVYGVSSATAKASGGNSPISMTKAMEAVGEEEAAQLQAAEEALNGLPWDPSSLAYAEAHQVDIVTNGRTNVGGHGVYAKSYAKAEADAEDGNSVAIAKSKDVNVTVKDDINAGKHGVYAASIAEATGDVYIEEQGNVTVNVKDGTVVGGDGYYGVAVKGGDENTVNIGKKGIVTSLSNDAILGGDEDETVNNAGMVIGNVDLGGGSNAFNNLSSGSFYTADIIDLNGGLLTNWGLLSPGGPGSIQTTALNGSLDQKSSGTYHVDIDMGNAKSDRINATGTAVLDGTVRGRIIKNVESGSETVTILSADGGATESATAVDTALVDYEVGTSGPNDVTLHMNVNFAPKGLDAEGTSVGQHLNQAFKNGNKALDELGLVLVNLPGVGDVVDAYNQLDGENLRATLVTTLYSAEAFQNDLMSCAVRDGSTYAVIDEDQCVYARVRFGNLDYGANAGTTGFDEDAVSITGGAQWTLNGAWHAGIAAGYENSDISTNGPRLSSDGDRFHIGGSLKYINGPWFFGGTIAGGWTDYDTTRWVSIPGFASTQTSSQDITDFGGQFRAAYLMTGGTWYAKPLVDLNVTYVDMDGFTERGGAAALRFASADETIFSATPALEIGTQMTLAGGTILRPFARGGVSFYTDGDFPLVAGFAAAPGVAPFRTTGEIDDVVGNVAAGLTILGTGRGVLSLSYDGAFGDDLEAHTGSAKASWRF